MNEWQEDHEQQINMLTRELKYTDKKLEEKSKLLKRALAQPRQEFQTLMGFQAAFAKEQPQDKIQWEDLD